MSLRPATRADLGRVRSVQAEWWGGRDLTALLQPLFLDNFASTSLIVDDADGSLVGFLIGFPSQDDPSAAYVHFVGVAPGHRGAGLGRSLHDAFAARMAERGAGTVRCVTSPTNADSIAFHQRIGFAVEARDDEYVHFVRESVAAPFASRPDPRPGDGPWPRVQWPLEPSTTLTHAGVTLRLATPRDGLALFEALDHDACWTHVKGRPETEDDVVQMVLDATRQGRWMWIVELEGRVVGTTSFLEVSPADARLEIGWTVYAPEVWVSRVNPSPVNPACKYLLMEWAFGHGFGRVQLKTDIRNVRSQQAIARLGAAYEGVLRRYQRRQDDSVRDTVVFSVTAEDWPRVREGLL
jgi:RimJ/RimL family protein N-acetyltransferase